MISKKLLGELLMPIFWIGILGIPAIGIIAIPHMQKYWKEKERVPWREMAPYYIIAFAIGIVCLLVLLLGEALGLNL